MAIKIKRRKPEGAEDAAASEAVEPEVIVEPDQILAVSQDSFSWMSENWKLLVAGIGGLVVAIGVGSTVMANSSRSKAADAQPLLTLVATSAATIGAESGAYATAQARHEATLAAAAQAPASVLVSGVTGGAKLATGDAAGAVEDLRSYTDALAQDPESMTGMVGLASALAASGQLDAGLATLDDLGDRAEELAPLVAVQRARLLDAFGSPSDALAAYRDAVREHPSAPGAGDVRNRIVQLEIQLGVDPEPVAAPEGSGEAPAGAGE